MEMDRLSALPDSLLFHILNRLGFKEAARTAVLLKQWRFLWTNVPLEFWDKSEKIEEIRRFVASVHAALAARTVNHSLCVSFQYDECFAPDVDSWLDFAAKTKVKNLSLLLRHDHSQRLCTLPQMIYSNSSLTHLSLGHCIMASLPETTAVEWRRLKTLSLLGVRLGQREIGGILSGCPVLETLELTICDGIERLEIGGRSFRRLSAYDCSSSGKPGLLEISAPYMRDLVLGGVKGMRKVRLQHVASIEIARIDVFARRWRSVPQEVMHNTVQLLQRLRHVNTLHLSQGCAKVVSMMATNGWQLPPLRLKELPIGIVRDVHNIYGVVAMLDSSPFVEKLSINLDLRKNLYEHEEEFMVNWGPITRDDLKDDLLQLKIVEFLDFDRFDESILILAQILLKRAPVLEEIVIVKSPSLSTEEIDLIKKTLLSYPKSSQKVSVEIRH